MTVAILTQADALIAAGRVGDGVALVRDAAAGGDADAIYQLAMWRLIGDPLPRDLPAARRLLRAAAQIGQPDAALVEVALTANGGGAPADWAAARRLLEGAACTDPVAADHLALLDAMALDATGAPTTVAKPEVLSVAPDIRLFRGLLTEGECGHLAAVVRDLLEPALVSDPRTGKLVEHPIRTSHDAVIGPTRETLVVQAINRRLAAASGTAVMQGEPLSVLHYAPGQQYRPHHDALPPQIARGNQRICTMLVYLNGGYEGGATRFTASGLEVRGQPGDMLLFANLLPGGAPDPATQHAGLPVTRGAKWLATRWVRAAPHDPWAG